MDFKLIKHAVSAQFERMKAHGLFVTAVDKDALWSTYLASFPTGSNPIYKTRTEHDCSCCRQFVRTVGNVVTIIDNKLHSIWDVTVDEPAYQTVADAMARLVKGSAVDNVFLHNEHHAGTDKNLQDTLDGVKTWNHFYVRLPSACVVHGDAAGTKFSEARSTFDVFNRGLAEITPDAINTVRELITQNSLYRGAEHKHTVDEFRRLKQEYDALPADARALYAWANSRKVSAAITRVRNTSIGTLLTDLSEGVELDKAVGAFEAKVAPANYKRPTALVTKAMIAKAKEKIEELGLTSSLERRYATIEDITVNNVLFADRSARKQMGVFDELAAKVPAKPKSLDKVEDVPVDKFLADILPNATSVEAMFDNKHVGNLVSLIAPVDPGSPGMFKWDNKFSWSYNGDVADSVKERVKAAGGNVAGDLCCRLAWYNFDDLDLHLYGPGHVGHIYYGSRGSDRGGMLDVDMNAFGPKSRTPVENIFFRSRSHLAEGEYELKVNCFNKRETDDSGFEAEIDFLGTVHRFAYAQTMHSKVTISVAKFTYLKKEGLKIIESLPTNVATRTEWGLTTQNFHKVHAIMASPNHWDGHGVGNKHWFFMLENCVNAGQARGFYNEFLRSELDPHRKVIEMVGAKLRTEQSDRQLSGLGFSSTQRNSLLLRVTGSFNRLINVTF